MLIACKCLNITLKSVADNLLSITPASISDYDDITNSRKVSIGSDQFTTMVSSTTDNLEDNRPEQSPFIQDSTADQLKGDQLQFFKTVNLMCAECTENNREEQLHFFVFLFCFSCYLLFVFPFYLTTFKQPVHQFYLILRSVSFFSSFFFGFWFLSRIIFSL